MLAIAVLPELVEQATQPTTSGTATPAEQATQQTPEATWHSAAESSTTYASAEHPAKAALLSAEHAPQTTAQ